MKNRSVSRNWVLLFVVILLSTVSAQTQNPSSDIELYQWSGAQWSRVDGSGVRVSVGPNGAPWLVKANGDIYRRTRDGYRQLPGAALDIGVGGDGSAWIIGTDSFVYRWTGRVWDRVNGSGVAISVDEDGDPWIVNGGGQVSRWDGERFVPVPGSARDIGAESSVWVVGRDGALQELQSTGRFSASRGSGMHVSAGANGQAWVVNDAYEIYRWNGRSFDRMPGAGSDVGANARGEVFLVGIPSAPPPPLTAEPRRSILRRR
jgi:hypothetical protein